MARSRPETRNAVIGSLAAFLALGLQIVDFVKKFEGLAQGGSLAASAVLLVLGGYCLWAGLSRKSRLLRPDVLFVDPDNPRHLKGRSDDIRTLCEAVRYPLVSLEGESGSGKSAYLVHIFI